ncbi:MAG: hypothetical protein BMS9Abin05_2109 [Rhodothermia bacterium]|nr:MAG: hypothetical protein BMS9Abin05_2109 [Rhodothermia bacterium]
MLLADGRNLAPVSSEAGFPLLHSPRGAVQPITAFCGDAGLRTLDKSTIISLLSDYTFASRD